MAQGNFKSSCPWLWKSLSTWVSCFLEDWQVLVAQQALLREGVRDPLHQQTPPLLLCLHLHLPSLLLQLHPLLLHPQLSSILLHLLKVEFLLLPCHLFTLNPGAFSLPDVPLSHQPSLLNFSSEVCKETLFVYGRETFSLTNIRQSKMKISK